MVILWLVVPSGWFVGVILGFAVVFKNPDHRGGNANVLDPVDEVCECISTACLALV
jgi:hypothetical protein